jgi:hypothetical protein
MLPRVIVKPIRGWGLAFVLVNNFQEIGEGTI